MTLSVGEVRNSIEQGGLRLPHHIAILLDGNGRWALHRGLTRPQGHRAGGETAKRCTRNCHALGIQALTLFGFSTENWNRPMEEVQTLIALLEEYLYDIAWELVENNVQLRLSGRIAQMPSRIHQAIDFALQKTAECTGMVLNLAINYGAKAEMVDSANAALVAREKGTNSFHLDQEDFRRFLYAPNLSFPDLLIRTSGEQRVSNFLLWQIEDAYYHITPTLWPDFDLQEIWQAILAFQHRCVQPPRESQPAEEG
ncbi:MAG: polyprenyl diphosphate synthase [Coprothermobacterota bacterium]|nr:polyprenyl diphosphate synthase [Coprothermobacterota bacterium]